MVESFEQNPKFLKERFPGLAQSPEVSKSAKRAEQRKDKPIPKDAEARIQNYLNRFKEIIERNDPKEKGRGINALKKILIDRFVIRVEDIPESYWEAQLQVVRSRGESGDWQDLSQEDLLKIKQEHLAQTKEDQMGSLEEWIDYLASKRSSYLPDYLKYWAFQGMLRLERYEKSDKEKDIPGRFPKRPTGRQRSVKMFPEVNERALKFITEAYEAQSKNQLVHFRYDVPEPDRQQFLEHLKKKDFRLIYGWAQEHLPPISEEEMQNTEGDWAVYKKGSNPKVLTRSLQGKGSGWCIAGEKLASQYLDQGKLSIYYTRDRDGQLTIPRVVIVETGDRVTEVRGIEWEENVDGYIKATDIIGSKLRELPGGGEFYETDKDTGQLTIIDKKISSGRELTRDDLIFLYEIERPIKYFGYKKDPRIEELRRARNSREDAPVVFCCDPSEIAWSRDEINDKTQSYIGKLDGEVLDLIQERGVEQVYASFPEGKVEIERDFEAGPITLEELERIIEVRNRDVKDESLKIEIDDYSKDMLRAPESRTLKSPEKFTLIRLKVAAMGEDFTQNGATKAEIIGRTDDVDEQGKPAPFTSGKMTKLGLELCPPEIGPYKRLKDLDQPMYQRYKIAMKPITGRYGTPGIFELTRDAFGLSLGHDWVRSDRQPQWYPDDEIVFRLPKFTRLSGSEGGQNSKP